MAWPTILYENVLEDATLTASSTATGYSVDSLKTRVPSDRWRSGSAASHTVTAQLAAAVTPTAFAITLHDVCGGDGDDPWTMQDTFDRANEAALAAPWTMREDGVLALTSNVATRAGDIAGVRAVYTHADPGLDENGYGWVEVDVRFSAGAAAGALHGAGVMLRWAAGPSYLYAVLRPQAETIALEKYGSSLGSPVASGALADNTWYTIRLEIDAVSVRVYLDGTLKITYTGSHGVAASQVVGLVVEGDDPALCVTDFNDFGSGILGTDDTPRGVVILRGGDDGVTWSYERAFVVETNGTIVVPFDDGASHDWWQFEIPVGTSRALNIGCLALGRRLDFTEGMASGFDVGAYKLVTAQNRSNSGSYLGSVVRYPSQSISLKFGEAGLDVDTFFGATGTPSWRDFLRTTWSIGRAFWFAWAYDDYPNEAWFCMVPDRAATTSPFKSSTRRGLTLTFDVLVEVVAP